MTSILFVGSSRRSDLEPTAIISGGVRGVVMAERQGRSQRQWQPQLAGQAGSAGVDPVTRATTNTFEPNGEATGTVGENRAYLVFDIQGRVPFFHTDTSRAATVVQSHLGADLLNASLKSPTG